MVKEDDKPVVKVIRSVRRRISTDVHDSTESLNLLPPNKKSRQDQLKSIVEKENGTAVEKITVDNGDANGSSSQSEKSMGNYKVVFDQIDKHGLGDHQIGTVRKNSARVNLKPTGENLVVHQLAPITARHVICASSIPSDEMASTVADNSPYLDEHANDHGDLDESVLAVFFGGLPIQKDEETIEPLWPLGGADDLQHGSIENLIRGVEGIVPLIRPARQELENIPEPGALEARMADMQAQLRRQQRQIQRQQRQIQRQQRQIQQQQWQIEQLDRIANLQQEEIQQQRQQLLDGTAERQVLRDELVRLQLLVLYLMLKLNKIKEIANLQPQLRNH